MRFTEPGKSFAAKLSIWVSGQIAFNQGACDTFGIKGSPYAVLYFAADVPAIGVELTEDKLAPGAIPILSRGTSASVSAKSFLQKFQLHAWMGRSFDLRKDEESGLLVAKLD